MGPLGMLRPPVKTIAQIAILWPRSLKGFKRFQGQGFDLLLQKMAMKSPLLQRPWHPSKTEKGDHHNPLLQQGFMEGCELEIEGPHEAHTHPADQRRGFKGGL